MKLNLLNISFLFLVTLTSLCFGGKDKKKAEYNSNKKEYLNNVTDIQVKEDARQKAQALIDTYCIETSTLKFRDVQKSIGAICKSYPDIICRQMDAAQRYSLSSPSFRSRNACLFALARC